MLNNIYNVYLYLLFLCEIIKIKVVDEVIQLINILYLLKDIFKTKNLLFFYINNRIIFNKEFLFILDKYIYNKKIIILIQYFLEDYIFLFIDYILYALIKIFEIKHNIIFLKVFTANKVSLTNKNKIEMLFKSIYSTKYIYFLYNQDIKLIAGFKVYKGDFVYDATILNSITNMFIL